MDNEKVKVLTEFLSQFQEFECPAKYYVAYKILVKKEEWNTQFDYIQDAYDKMLEEKHR